MSIKDKLNNDFKEAMKNKDKELLVTLRLVKELIQNEEIKIKSDLNDEETLNMFNRELKQTRESLEAYAAVDNKDKVSELENRVIVLQSYMPLQLTEDEIRTLVSSLINDNDIEGKKDKGKLMKVLMPQVKGRAEGALVNKIVGELLQ